MDSACNAWLSIEIPERTCEFSEVTDAEIRLTPCSVRSLVDANETMTQLEHVVPMTMSVGPKYKTLIVIT